MTNAATLSHDLLYTLTESLIGLALALVGCIFTRVLWVWVPFSTSTTMRWAVALKSVPVVAIAPLLTVWFGNALGTKAVLAAMISFFPILVGFHDGRRSVPSALLDIAELAPASGWRRFWYIELPASLPSVTSSLTVAAPLATVGALVAEFSGADVGVGHLILISAYRNQVVAMTGGIVLAAALGVVLYGAAAGFDLAVRRRLRHVA